MLIKEELYLKEHTKEEVNLVRKCRSPCLLQNYIDSLIYEGENPTNREYEVFSFRNTIKRGKSSCLSAALTASHILECYGHKPFVLAIWAKPYSHAVAIYKQDGRVGSIGKSRHNQIEGRKAIYSSERELARTYCSYMDSIGNYVSSFAVISLNNINLDWRFDKTDLYEKGLCLEICNENNFKRSRL